MLFRSLTILLNQSDGLLSPVRSFHSLWIVCKPGSEASLSSRNMFLVSSSKARPQNHRLRRESLLMALGCQTNCRSHVHFWTLVMQCEQLAVSHLRVYIPDLPLHINSYQIFFLVLGWHRSHTVTQNAYHTRGRTTEMSQSEIQSSMPQSAPTYTHHTPIYISGNV